jgi:hypothetical protein
MGVNFSFFANSDEPDKRHGAGAFFAFIPVVCLTSCLTLDTIKN